MKLKNKKLLMGFLFYLNEKDLINNHDFDYKKKPKNILNY